MNPRAILAPPRLGCEESSGQDQPSAGGGSGAETGRSSRTGVWVVVLAVGALIALSLYAFDPAKGGWYPVCYFHQATGLLCPGCGGLRAMHQLLHGHLAAAWYFNPLLVLAMPPTIALTAWLAVRRFQGRAFDLPLPPAWLWTGGGLVLVFSVLRNLSLPHLAWLGLHP